jgi:hypothetical protein
VVVDVFIGRVSLLAVLILGGVFASVAVGADVLDSDTGRRMYREGILPSGEPLTAIVAGDVPVLGTQFSCQNCHGRSGMGSAEGTYIVPAIAGRMLFVPSPQPERPAYDNVSLAKVLREGVTSSGRQLNPLMPRYVLSDAEVADMAVYLDGLSAGDSPGVDNKVIRLATVITSDVSPDVRSAVLAVLQAFVEDKNKQTRGESQRLDRGSTPASQLPTLHRDWQLDVWELKGPADSWGEQLEAYYKESPVFVLLSGVSAGSWGPIGRFCESNEIPCLFPGTDLPDAGESDFYTQYFSRGLNLEADLIAYHLSEQPPDSVIQVFCGDVSAGAAAALHSKLEPRGINVDDIEFDCDAALPVTELNERLAAAQGAAAVVLWVRREQLANLTQPLPAGRVYLSSTLLDRQLDELLPSVPGPLFVAHPFRLPGKTDSAFMRFTIWARSRGIEIRYPRLQSEAFFACLATNDVLMHLQRYFVRDYVLDMLDHAQGLSAYLPIYPRPTLGPGQRFLTKGGYVLPVLNGQPDSTSAAWIQP